MRLLNRLAAIVAAALLICAPAAAQKLSALPAAATLTGAEKLAAAQGSGCATGVTPCATVAITPAQLATYLSALYQAADADLSAIAALSTTSTGRDLLTSADAAAIRTKAGLGTLATQSGTFSGTSSGTNTGDQTNVTGNAGTATTLQTPRTIGATGDVTFTTSAFNGSANVTGTATLATSGVTAGSYGSTGGVPSITFDAKGRATAALTVTLGVAGGGTGDTGTAWTAYTPTITTGSGSFTSATAVGRYKQIGKTVFVWLRLLISTNGTAAGNIALSLPANARTSGSSYDTIPLLATEVYSVGKILAGNVSNGGATVVITNPDGSYFGGGGYDIVLSGTYEAQ